MGVFDVLMHVPPDYNFFWYKRLYVRLHVMYSTYVPDTGYQWAPFACRYDYVGSSHYQALL
jgi:hypothetical protein